jgi:hypothetical protein
MIVRNMTYKPKTNDYVTWAKGVEGWVYFVDDEYITIEYFVRPKDEVNYLACSIHANERLLVVCYKEDWNQLKYIKSRKSIYEEEENCVPSDC